MKRVDDFIIEFGEKIKQIASDNKHSEEFSKVILDNNFTSKKNNNSKKFSNNSSTSGVTDDRLEILRSVDEYYCTENDSKPKQTNATSKSSENKKEDFVVDVG